MMVALGPLARHLHIPDALQVSSPRPWIGILAVMLAALVSTLTSRLTSFGLADIGGQLGAGFDERAWITTTFGCAQMFIGPVSAWLSLVFGIRRVLMSGALLLGASELLLPYCRGLGAFLVLQFTAGLGSGTFIPLTIGFVLRSLPKPLWAFGISAYAMNLELSLNIGATIEGWYINHGAWAWIFWQNAIIALAMTVCIFLGVPREPVNREEHGRGDYWGMLFAGLGFTLIYAALDQGNRLDWFSSGLIVGLMAAGALLLIAFALHEYAKPQPSVDFRFIIQRNVLELLAILVLARLLILGANFLVPQFLTQVTGFRPQQVGQVLLWVALPQLIIGPMVGLLLKRWDGRYLLAAGALLMVIANVLSSRLSSVWAEPNFIPPLLLQAVGQTMLLTALVYLLIQHLRPTQVLTFGAIVQATRLFGGQIALAFLFTYTRKAEQFHSNLIGQHVVAGEGHSADRLQAYAQAHGLDSLHNLALLSSDIARQAMTLAYSDGFVLLAAAAAIALVITAMLHPPPSEPLS